MTKQVWHKYPPKQWKQIMLILENIGEWRIYNANSVLCGLFKPYEQRLTALTLENDSWKLKMQKSGYVISRNESNFMTQTHCKIKVFKPRKQMSLIEEWWIDNVHSSLCPWTTVSIPRYTFSFRIFKVNSLALLTTVSESSMLCFEERDNLVQHTMYVKTTEYSTLRVFRHNRFKHAQDNDIRTENCHNR